MKFEIINPSDECYIEGDDFKTIAVATALLGNGSYGLTQVDGDLEMPILCIAGFGDPNTWFLKQFNETADQIFKSINKEELKKVLISVHLLRERSSLNDIVKYARILAKRIK